MDGYRGRSRVLLRAPLWTARVLAVVVAMAVLAIGAFAYSLRAAVEDNLNVLPADAFAGLQNRPAHSGRHDDDLAVTILLAGSDRDRQIESDSLTIVRLSGDRGHIDVLSLPRDSWVQVPGFGEKRLRETARLGGAPLILATVEGVTGLRVDHLVQADFDLVTAVADAVGGVPVVNPEPTTDPLTKVGFPAGNLELKGDDAVVWVRQIFGLPHEDLDRIVRQQQFLAGAFGKIAGADVTAMPRMIRDVAVAISRSVTVDAEFTVDRITELVTDVVAVPRDKIRRYTAPVLGTSMAPDGNTVVNLDRDLLTRGAKAIDTDMDVPLTQNVLPGL